MSVNFSIIIVCLNPGTKLKDTLESVKKQTYKNYEIIIKDGGSTDNSLEYAREAAGEFPSLHIIEKKDKGIYDAMNQAVFCLDEFGRVSCDEVAAGTVELNGRYVYFLNCGDILYDEYVLEKVNDLIKAKPSVSGIYYGNIYDRLTGNVVASNPDIDAFGCYRNVPCHQACFYDEKILKEHMFDTKYRVRADYEQFLWCFFAKEASGKISFVYGDILIADYEGDGFSETKQNRKISAKEHWEIVKKYMPAAMAWKYRIIMWVTFAPVRTWLSGNRFTAGLYNGLKRVYYGKGVKK